MHSNQLIFSLILLTILGQLPLSDLALMTSRIRSNVLEDSF